MQDRTNSARLHPLRLSLRAASMVVGTRHGRTLVLCAGLSLINLSACVENEARQQAAAQQVIEDVASEFRSMNLGVPALAEGDETAQQRQVLGQLLSKLSGLTGAAPGQQAAANSLAGQIAANMGELAADRLRDLESDLRAQRAATSPRIDSAVRLGILAAALESFDPAADRASLERLRAEAVEAIEASRRRVGELDQPVAALVADNETSRALLLELEREEAQLRAQARGAGPIGGFKFVEQAAEKRTQADAFRVRIARNDVQLAELTPEQTMALLGAEQGSQIVQTLDVATADLNSMRESAQQLAAASRARINAIRDEVATAVGAIDSSISGPLTEFHGEAVRDFEKAAQFSQRGATPDAGRDGQLAAKVSVATAQQALAQAHWSFALALGDQVAFLERIAAIPGLAADPDALRSAAAALTTTREEAVQQAKAAAEAALESAGQSASDTPDNAMIKANLVALIDAMSGKTMKLSGSALANAPTSEVPGFESPETLLAYFQQIDAAPPDAATVRSMAYAFRASSSKGRLLQGFMGTMFEDGAEFFAATAGKFGGSALGAGDGSAMASEPSKLKVGEVRENKATLDPTEPGVKAVPLIRSGGRWYIDMDGVIATGGPEVQQSLAAAQMFQQAAPMMDKIRAGIRSASSDVATRVKAGEFSSGEEAQVAFQMAIQEKMMAMMGDLMGGLGGGLGDPSGGAGAPGAGDLKAIEEAARKAMENLSPEERKQFEEMLKSGQVPNLPKP